MASTMVIFYDKGAGPTPVSTAGGGTKLRLQTDDNADNIDGNFPCIKPAAGSNYSYWIHLYLEMTVRPTTEVVNNVKLYTDAGGYGTGVTTNVGDENPAHTAASTAGYDQATGTQGTTGDEIIANHTGITAVTDLFSFTSGVPRDLTIGEAGGVIDLVGETCNYVVIQALIGTTVTSQAFSAETWTFRYDEVL